MSLRAPGRGSLDRRSSAAAVGFSDRLQEAAIASLPDNRRSSCESKGRLHFAIKDINSAGQALHSGDLEAAAKCNLKVLYRRGKGKAATDPPAPAPAPTK
jgi:hypothetical protein